MVQRMLLNPQAFDLEKVQKHLALRDNIAKLRPLMVRVSLLIVGTFVISSVLNYFVTRRFVNADPHQNYELYAEQIGRLTWIQQVAIALPLMVLMLGIMIYLINGLGKLTGLHVQEMVVGHEDDEEEEETDKAVSS